MVNKINNSVIFELDDVSFLEFELHIPIEDAYKWIGTNGYLRGKYPERCIFSEDYLFEALTELTDKLTKRFQFSDPIKPSIFEQGIGHYSNMKLFHTPDDTLTDEQQRKLDLDFPKPSVKGKSLYLWSTPTDSNNAQTWMYSHMEKVYLETAAIYDWDECDEQDYANFSKFMKTFQAYRFEITPDKATQFYDISVNALAHILEAQEAESFYSQLKDFKQNLTA